MKVSELQEMLKGMPKGAEIFVVSILRGTTLPLAIPIRSVDLQESFPAQPVFIQGVEDGIP